MTKLMNLHKHHATGPYVVIGNAGADQTTAPTMKANILGVLVDAVTVEMLHHYIKATIRKQEKRMILHVNVHLMNLVFEHPWLRDFINSAPLVFCDGAGVVLGARLLGYHMPQRITYADWMWQLAAFAADNNFSIYCLGSLPSVADKAATVLQAQIPNLKIAGTHHGYFDKTAGSQENQTVIHAINRARADILIVGFGMPLQETWLRQNLANIEVPVILTGGAVFDWIAGDLRRSPKWMRDNGLEWLGRLLSEPRRLWRRYVLGNPLFLWRLLKQKLQQSIDDV